MADPGHNPPPPDEALLDLLVKQVTEGLSPAEERELQALESGESSRWQRDLEHAAAALSVAARGDGAPLPAALAATIAAQAQAHFAQAPVAPGVTSLAAVRETRRGPGAALGWLAAAACLVLALFGWLRTPPEAPPRIVTIEKQAPPPVPPKPVSDADKRLALLAKPAAYKVALGATKDPAAAGLVSGDVVWDPETQQGYLHFVGLKSNDPAVQQYQVWIFDGGRDKRFPVDGGVFDIPADANEVVIPIRTSLMVRKPAAFAVTVEKPGGVVVSAKDHVVVLGTTG